MNTVVIEEKKYLINLVDYARLDSLLESTFTPDEHNGNNGYSVRSLYFDTIDDQDFQDKVDGLDLHRKIRLRIYNPFADFAMLEMKQKQGIYQKKRSLRLCRKDAEQIIQANYTSLLGYKDSFATECFALMYQYHYRPKAVVEYRRKAYIAKENHIRITLDSGILATEGAFDIYDTKLILNPVLESSNAILEVKYSGFLLSYIKDILRVANRSEISISKYCLARSLKNGY